MSSNDFFKKRKNLVAGPVMKLLDSLEVVRKLVFLYHDSIEMILACILYFPLSRSRNGHSLFTSIDLCFRQVLLFQGSFSSPFRWHVSTPFSRLFPLSFLWGWSQWQMGYMSWFTQNLMCFSYWSLKGQAPSLVIYIKTKPSLSISFFHGWRTLVLKF